MLVAIAVLVPGPRKESIASGTRYQRDRDDSGPACVVIRHQMINVDRSTTPTISEWTARSAQLGRRQLMEYDGANAMTGIFAKRPRQRSKYAHGRRKSRVAIFFR